MKRFLRSLALALFCILAAAQTAVVRHNVNLRPDASTDHDPIETLKRGAQLTLIEPDPTDGYYHVTAPDGQTGFVWGRNIRVQQGVPAPTPTPTPTSTPTPGPSATPTPSPTPGDLFSQLMAARKTAVGQPLVINGTQVCGPEGDTSDANAQALNDNKNRTDVPGTSDYVEIKWDDLKNLPADRVADFQGAPVMVVGFLSHQVKVETGGESTNCHLHSPDEVDWHMYLTNAQAQGIADAVIVETTPRTRPAHKWTTASVGAFVDSSTQIRISGWLMFDFEHTDVIGTQRVTVWEVHPITRIEVQENGQWVDLDQ
jgi:Bacterial SH3 domain